MLIFNDNPFLPPSETIPKKIPLQLIQIKKIRQIQIILIANLDIAFNNIYNNSNINEYNSMEKNFTNKKKME